MENPKREIKYRIWDPEAQLMMGFEEIHMTSLMHLNLSQEELGWENMQFTGRKDKNGKEIYEGDIVKDPLKRIWEVFWWEKESGFYYRNASHEVYSTVGMADCEVIGNIWENGDLLK